MSSFSENIRIYPIDLFVCQPGVGGTDPNTAAANDTWGDNQHWTFINDVRGLVNHVNKRCLAVNYIRVLRIGGHGSVTSFNLGNTLIQTNNISALETVLAEIKPYFKPGKSLVILDHCDVGNSDFLLQELSRMLGGVTVMGPLSEQYNNDGAPELEGAARICNAKFCMITANPNAEPQKIIRTLSEMQMLFGG